MKWIFPILFWITFADRCLINNGGCDNLTTCYDDNVTIVCGNCPIGFSGNGSVGCVDIDECANVNPCFNNTQCTNNNLTLQNLTFDSCICASGRCVFLNSNTTIFGNAAVGKYTCLQYSTYQTKTYSHTACSLYTSANSQFNITVSSIIKSTSGRCGVYVSWNIMTSTSTTLYRSQALSSASIPASYSQFLYPNCTTVNRCTEVETCGVDQKCRINNNSCIVNMTNIMYDPTTDSVNCIPQLQPKIQRCQRIGSSDCMLITNSPWYVNGKYVCTIIAAFGCTRYVKIDFDYMLQLVGPIPQTYFDCEDVFQYTITNGTSSFSGVSNDIRQDISQANFTFPNPFKSCTSTYFCSNCSAGYTGSGYLACQDINECATNNGYCENSLCINTPGSYQCGSCYQGYSGLPCAWIPYFATLRLTNVEVETNNISLTTFYAIAKGYTLANYEFTIQSVNDDPIFVYRSPAGTRARQIVQVRPGNYSIYPGYFFNIPVPYYREGIVQTQVSNGDDVFLTSFLVKRPTTASTEGIAVLDYQSTSANLNLMIRRFTPTFSPDNTPACEIMYFGSPCTTATSQLQFLTGSNNSQGVETAVQRNFQRNASFAPNPFYNYLYYVDSLTFLISRYDPQLSFYWNTAYRTPAQFFKTNINPLANVNNLGRYWVICCYYVPQTGVPIIENVFFKPITSGGYSVFTNALPLPSTYC